VVEELQKKKELVEQVAPRVMQEELDYRQQLVFFTEDEVEEAVKLWAARRERRANEQELKLLSTREQEAGDRARKFQQLVTKETLTEEEKRELAFLREIRAGRLEQLQQLERAYEQQMARLRQSYQDADRRAFEELRKAAQRVGERLGMDLVFTSEALLFGGISITQDVIDDLQANVPSLAAIGGVAEEGAAP
jgi:Skp family chaperone for outer membrane proteins